MFFWSETNHCCACCPPLPSQAPAVRTEYLRTAWQRYDSNTVRLSLDEHMLLLREKHTTSGPTGAAAAGNGPSDEWCASVEGSAQLAAGDVVRFPYGILEIKLQDEAPAWIRVSQATNPLAVCTVNAEV
eukprot:GHUV01034812.1.p1 GENE.GHUV01034812.1~~GHUV01034812.1.p1  ORF type:complete len:129 (-),score=39.02 GHUV01034812.1:197-583(-)